MRKITAGLFISLDGVVEDPQDWHFPYFNDEMGAAVDSQLGAADTLLLGRSTYDSFAGAWPDREAAGGEDADFAKKLGDARKVVVSTRAAAHLAQLRALKGDLVEAVGELKNEPGATDIAMSGSVSVVRQLLAAGLLDELHLLVHPIAVRKDAPVRGGRCAAPVAAGLLPDVHHRRGAPRLRRGRADPRGLVRRREGAPAAE